ncbi:MAG: hypothetical protein IJ784_04955 [Ruminiclostridium sp.]|nr:hypothetical protein [Ruminiclostridium sp.]HBI52348.1 hypothetical protein [Oscillospiraceae bacterium]
MAGECLVIALILGVLNVGFFRAHRKNWGLAVLPLGFVPFVTGIVLYTAEHLFHYEFTFLLPMILIVTSLMVSCIWIGLASAILIKTKRMRVYYLAASVGFVFTLSIIMLLKYYWLFFTA